MAPGSVCPLRGSPVFYGDHKLYKICIALHSSRFLCAGQARSNVLTMDEQDVPKIPTDGPGLRYMAVADHITGLVKSGKLRPGARLASERELADEYGVSYMTVRRAMKELRERGTVVSVHGKGTFITDNAGESPTS